MLCAEPTVSKQWRVNKANKVQRQKATECIVLSFPSKPTNNYHCYTDILQKTSKSLTIYSMAATSPDPYSLPNKAYGYLEHHNHSIHNKKEWQRNRWHCNVDKEQAAKKPELLPPASWADSRCNSCSNNLRRRLNSFSFFRSSYLTLSLCCSWRANSCLNTIHTQPLLLLPIFT